MADKLLRALGRLTRIDLATADTSPLHALDPRAKIITTLLYLVALLSVPLLLPARIMLMAIYPIMIGVVGHLRGRTILGWSLVALPFAVAVGAFNPLIDRVPVGEVAGVVITRGWVTLVSITLRAVVSVAVVVELVLSTGLYRLCINAGRLGVPRVIVVLLLMLVRYVRVLMGEALVLRMAVDARRHRRGALPLRVWARIVARLLVRSVFRARRIGMALQARAGGELPHFQLASRPWQTSDTLWIVLLTAVIALLRFFPLKLLSL
jgi:cobalt/nickel transport system permease protein